MTEVEVWQRAIILSHNLCVQISDRYNDDDQTMESKIAHECALKIKEWLDLTKEQIENL
jgi:hypothetical protein